MALHLFPTYSRRSSSHKPRLSSTFDWSALYRNDELWAADGTDYTQHSAWACEQMPKTEQPDTRLFNRNATVTRLWWFAVLSQVCIELIILYRLYFSRLQSLTICLSENIFLEGNILKNKLSTKFVCAFCLEDLLKVRFEMCFLLILKTSFKGFLRKVYTFISSVETFHVFGKSFWIQSSTFLNFQALMKRWRTKKRKSTVNNF